jgi:hypothetical protein
MESASWEAVDLTYRNTGEWDYYPLLNALDGTFLAAARGDRSAFDTRMAQFPNLLQAARDNARRRFADDRSFFHALADVEADRIDALWATLDGRSHVVITRPEILEALTGRYCNVLRRLGTAREHDSATNQLRFLIDMLPSSAKLAGLRKALTALADGIRTC